VVVPGRLEPRNNGLTQAEQQFDEAVVLRLGVRNDETSPPGLARDLDQNVVAKLRDVNGYQNGVR
jgi:hypothetical protein